MTDERDGNTWPDDEPEQIDLRSTDSTDSDYSETARTLAASMSRQAERFEPSADSFLRLQQAVDAEGGATVTTLADRRQRSAGALRLAVAAAALIALIGTAGWLALDSGGEELETGPAATSTPAAPPTTTVAPSTTTTTATEAIEEVVPEVPAVEFPSAGGDDITGPRRLTPEEAASAFMTFVRMPYSSIEIDGTVAMVRSRDEDGSPGNRVAVELDIAAVPMFDPALGDGYTVVAARAVGDVVTITSPRAGDTIDTSALAIEGEGLGFERNVAFRLFSNHDGVLLAQSATFAGDLEPEPYLGSIDVMGRDSGWIVAVADLPADNVTPLFAAIPIEWDAGEDPTVYTVSNVRVGDPDGGLNVRALPGSDEGEVRATLPPDTSGIRRRGRVPAFINGVPWWNIRTDAGVEGWVNSHYLVRAGGVPEDQLNAIGDEFATAVTSEDPAAISALPWATHRPITVGWFGGLRDLTAEELRSADFWDATATWTIPSDGGTASLDSSLRQFVKVVESPTIVATPIDREQTYDNALVQETIDLTFHGLASVTIDDADPTVFGPEDRAVTLFVEPTAEGPRIVGMAVWVPAS